MGSDFAVEDRISTNSVPNLLILYLTIMNHGVTNRLVHENQQDTYRLLYLDHMKKNLVQMNSVPGSYEPMASGPEEQQQPY